MPYDAFYGFLENPIKPRYMRYRSSPVGEAQPSRHHYVHTQGIYFGVDATEHILNACLSIYLLYLPNSLNLSNLPNRLYL
jgi:hypothetical protein